MGKKKQDMDDFLSNLGLGVYNDDDEVLEEVLTEEDKLDEEEEISIEEKALETVVSEKEEIIEEEKILDISVKEKEELVEEIKKEVFTSMTKKEEKEEENVGGNNMEKSLSEVIITSEGFKKYEKSLSGEFVRNLISNKLLQNVQLIKMNRHEFHEKFLASNVELSNVEKDDFIKEFYPSALNGSSVEYIMTVDIPVSALENESALGQNTTKPLFWKSNAADIKKYTRQHPEIFGSRNLNPVLLITNTDGEKVYRLFISTLHALLYAEGLTVEKLKDKNVKVAITNVMTALTKLQPGTKDPIQTGLNNGTITFSDNYVLQYIKF